MPSYPLLFPPQLPGSPRPLRASEGPPFGHQNPTRQLAMVLQPVDVLLRDPTGPEVQAGNGVVKNLRKEAYRVTLVGKIGGGEVSRTLLWASLEDSLQPKTRINVASLFAAMKGRVMQPDYPKGRGR